MTTSTTTGQTPRKDEASATTQTMTPRKLIGRFIDSPDGQRAAKIPLAVFCHEPPDSFIGSQMAQVVSRLAKMRPVTLFSRHPYSFVEPNVKVQAVGTIDDEDCVVQVKEYVKRASNAFLQAIPADKEASVLAYEWSAAGVLPLLRGLRNQRGVLSLHSLERQRSDLSSDLSKQINEIEREALDAADRILVHDAATGEHIRLWLPPCAERLVIARERFPVEQYEGDLDPGAIKARYEVGPIDPVLLYVGDLDDRYGPELLVKAMPALLRHHPQARLVIVGDGPAQWPLRVYARYLLLEHAVRIVGSVVDQPLRELVQASDVVCVPSRESTPWWPILAGWAAKRPVVVSHDAAKGLQLEHEKDSVLVYPSENSIVWGVERLLYDADLRKSIGEAGRKKVEERFGYDGVVEQLAELVATAAR